MDIDLLYVTHCQNRRQLWICLTSNSVHKICQDNNVCFTFKFQPKIVYIMFISIE